MSKFCNKVRLSPWITVKPLILATLNFGVLSQFNYFGPRNFGVFASYYTETLLYSNFRGLLFSRTCQAREIREIKGTRKKQVLQYHVLVKNVRSVHVCLQVVALCSRW